MKKYKYTYNLTCVVCQKSFVTARSTAKCCSPGCVSSLLASQKRVYSEDQIETAIKLLAEGSTRAEICKKVGMTKASLDRLLRDRGLRSKPKHRKLALKRRWANYDPFEKGKLRCSACGKLKLANSFWIDNHRKSGHSSKCKDCSTE